MSNSPLADGSLILVAAPFGRDAESLADLLRAEHHAVRICQDLVSVAMHAKDSVGAILLTEEALAGGIEALRHALQSQPTWSDIPLIVLARPNSGRKGAAGIQVANLFDLSINTVVLERPMGRAPLVSAIASAVRARRKQFEMRDQLVELAHSEGRLRLATSAADIGTWDYDPVMDRLTWDVRCKALFGLPADAVVTYDGSFVAGLHPEDRASTVAAVNQALDPGGNGEYEIEYRTVAPVDGVERWIAAKGGSLFEHGRAVRFIGTVIDITPRKSAEIALEALNRTLEDKVANRTQALEREMASRTQAETALRQSQKMEAVGQLTGGIAHDFNNMLTGVIGSLDILKRRLEAGRTEGLNRYIDAASSSAQRAASLTARLLAFSRRQSLDSKPLDVDALVRSLNDLLRSTIPESISLELVPSAGNIRAVADANQLENAILNLAINARDAMPAGGKLTIETSLVDLDADYAAAKPDIEAGTYVIVAVSDTGVGMPPDILEKAFDPFYTTKPIGQGTGLGLSMVYGFARQSGGQVRIHSSPGEGTSVKIYLPATQASEPVSSGPASSVVPGAGQTILLVEDDEAVRMLVHELLTDLHYCILEARDADTALPILSSDHHIDLMISDVGLPGMNGRQIAEIARKDRPDLPILFITGYAENAAIRAGFLGTKMEMIAKPFNIDVLSAKISEMVGIAD